MSMKSELEETEESSSVFSHMEDSVYEGRKGLTQNRFSNGKETIFTSDLVEKIISFLYESNKNKWQLFLKANGSLSLFKEGFSYNSTDCFSWLNRCPELHLVAGENEFVWENLDLK